MSVEGYWNALTQIKACVGVILLTAVMQSAPAQTNILSSGNTWLPSSTNTATILASTGTAIRVSGSTINFFNLPTGGSMTIPESRGKSTYIRSTANGGLYIREPGPRSLTTVTPVGDGGVIVRGPDNKSIYVTPGPGGNVRISGPRSKTTVVTAGRDGTITIWSRGGRSYTIPMPQQNSFNPTR